MKSNYEVVVSEHTWMVNQSKSSVQLYFLDGIQDESGVVYQIEMKVIYETQPESRLMKLLNRGLIKEAEVMF